MRPFRLYGQPAADCKRERKYVTGALLNTEETTGLFQQLVMGMFSPNSWMVLVRENARKLDDGKGYPYFRKAPDVLKQLGILYQNETEMEDVTKNLQSTSK